MKNKERIAILETEISRLKVANRNTNERLEVLISHLAKQHRGANFSKSNKPEAPECLEAGSFSEHVSKNIDAILEHVKSDEPIKPDFIPEWKDAPEDAVCVAMDKSGIWFWWRDTPIAALRDDAFWSVPSGNGLSNINYGAGSCNNTALLPPDYWKTTLMMRPEAKQDYTHLLPEGYEFCQEADAEKWVKVECPKWYNPQTDVGEIIEWPLKVSDKIKPFWRPIRPIVYHVAVHEAVTAVPDAYQVDWENAPDDAVAHAWDKDGNSFWYRVIQIGVAWDAVHEPSNLPAPPHFDWEQSKRVRPHNI